MKKFEEIQKQDKIQVAKVEVPAGMTAQDVKVEGAPVEKSAQVVNVAASVGKPAQVVKAKGAPVETTAQVAKLEGGAPGGKNNIPMKNVQTLKTMNGSTKSDAIANVRTTTVKTQAPKPIVTDRDDSYKKIVLGTEESDDTETTSTSSTSYKPDYESALRDATDDDDEAEDS